jgi:hypothetical protein
LIKMLLPFVPLSNSVRPGLGDLCCGGRVSVALGLGSGGALKDPKALRGLPFTVGADLRFINFSRLWCDGTKRRREFLPVQVQDRVKSFRTLASLFSLLRSP